MIGAPSAGVALGLAAAAVWGGGDFCGGLATRRLHPAVVVCAVSLSGSLLLLAAALLAGEPLPGPGHLAWSGLAGLAGALGLAALYRALAVGHAAVVAPVAAVAGALVPVAFGLLALRPPSLTQLLGFALAMAGVALVTRAPPGQRDAALRGLGTAIAGGVALGGFLVLMARAGESTLFLPLLAARLVMLLAGVLAAVVLAVRPRVGAPLGVALLGGLLDVGGNLLYLLATHSARVDVAGVLASLYPVSTVLLSRLLLGQAVGRVQWSGVGVCAAAVVLIAG